MLEIKYENEPHSRIPRSIYPLRSVITPCSQTIVKLRRLRVTCGASYKVRTHCNKSQKAKFGDWGKHELANKGSAATQPDWQPKWPRVLVVNGELQTLCFLFSCLQSVFPCIPGSGAWIIKNTRRCEAWLRWLAVTRRLPVVYSPWLTGVRRDGLIYGFVCSLC